MWDLALERNEKTFVDSAIKLSFHSYFFLLVSIIILFDLKFSKEQIFDLKVSSQINSL